MRILIVNQHRADVVGGSEIQCDLVARYLTQAGHEICYLAVNGIQADYRAGYQVVRSNLNSLQLVRVVRDFRPDIVYWRYNKNKLLQSVLVFKLFGVKVIHTIAHIRDTKPFVFGHYYSPRELLVGLRQAPSLSKKTELIVKGIATFGPHLVNYQAFRLVDGVISINEQFLGRLPVRRQVLVKNSINPKRVAFRWPRSFVVWVANIKSTKNPERYLELAAALTGLQTDFLMVGEIVEPKYRHTIEKAENEFPHFHYLGPKTFAEVNGILAQSLFLVHTCSPEGFPNNFIQAWTQGRPTVSLYYDPDRVIASERIGFVSGAPSQFEKDVRRLISDSTLRTDMGRRAKEFSEKNFRPETNIKKLEQFLESVVEPR